MEIIKAIDLGLSSVMVDTTTYLPVIRTEQIKYSKPIYLVLKSWFEDADEEDEIPLGYSNIVNGQIRLDDGGFLKTDHGLMEKKKYLTVIE